MKKLLGIYVFAFVFMSSAVFGDYKIEAEAFALSNGYVINSYSSASNGQIIKAERRGQENLAITQFNGIGGSYDLVIRYLDEDDGVSTISLYVNDMIKDTFNLSEDNNAWIERTIAGITLQTGDEIKLVAVSRTGEFARVDYVELLGNDGVLTVTEPLVPANCKGNMVKSGIDTNGNGILDESEITSVVENYTEGTPLTRAELDTMIANGDDVTTVNTCKIIDMSELFRDNTAFNQDISGWNTGSVTNMSRMFSGAESFNQPIGDWDVSNVTDMSWMFEGFTDKSDLYYSRFNQFIGDWDVSNVKNMSYMFLGATEFNQPIGDWDVSNVTDMSWMFAAGSYLPSKFNQPIGDWDVSNVTDMSRMFVYTGAFNQPIGDWDVSNVTDMSEMFRWTRAFNQPIGDWDVSNVKNMSYMFFGATVFNQPIGDWDVSNVTDMSGMFNRASLSVMNYNILLLGWSTLNLHNGVYFSAGDSQYSVAAQSARDILTDTFGWTITDGGVATTLEDYKLEAESFTLSNGYVISTYSSASNGQIIKAERRGQENVAITQFNGIGGSYDMVIRYLDEDDGVSTISLYVNGTLKDTFNLSEDNNAWMDRTIAGITLQDGDEIKIIAVSRTGEFARVDYIELLGNDGVLTVTEPLVPANCEGNIVKSGIDTNANGILDESEITSVIENYTEGAPLTRAELDTMIANGDDVTAVNTCKITDMSQLFRGYHTFNQDISGWNTGSVTDMSYMFGSPSGFGSPLNENDRGATNFNQPIGDWDVSKVTDMSGMFKGAELFNQPIGNWDVSNVTDMSEMFSYHVYLLSEEWGLIIDEDYHRSNFNQPIGDWDVSSVTDMSGMFVGAEFFNQPIGDWDVSSVTDMSGMFVGAEFFNQPIGDWDVSNVTNMSRMFSLWFGGITDFICNFNQPIGDWDVSNVTNMSHMFKGAEFFNQPIGNWNVSNVTDMSEMFYQAELFNQPIGNWNVSNVTNMSYMFYQAGVFNQPIGDWDVSSVKDMSWMFAYTPFNQPIGDWDVSGVTDMSWMFAGASSFNQPIGDLWDVSSVTDMSRMFASTPFNQPIGDWDVSSVTDMYEMLTETSLSVENYDNLLLGWSTLNLQNGVLFTAGESRYSSSAQSARDILTDTFGWTITDGGVATTLEDYKLEAESFTLSNGYVITTYSSASNGQIIKAERRGQENLAITQFNGIGGSYDLVIRYLDEDDGVSTISLYVNDTLKDTFNLSEDNNAWMDRTIAGITLQDGDEIKIIAVSRTGEFARVDYVELLAN